MCQLLFLFSIVSIIYIFYKKVKQKNATRTELAKILKKVGEASVLKPEVNIKEEKKISIVAAVIQSECTDIVTTPEKTDAITPEKEDKHETEKTPTFSQVPLQFQELKPLDLQKVTNNTPPSILIPTITEKIMKRPSPEYTYHLRQLC